MEGEERERRPCRDVRAWVPLKERGLEAEEAVVVAAADVVRGGCEGAAGAVVSVVVA